MADEEIKYQISAEGAEAAASSLNKLAAAGKNVEESAGRTELGAKGLRVGFHDLAHQLGVTGMAGRVFGHEMADLTMALGSGAGALGIATAVAVVGYMAYEHFAGNTEKATEALNKNVSSLQSEVKALYANNLETVGVTKSQKELLEVKRAIYLIEAPARIRQETKELEELNKKQQAGMGVWEKLKTVIMASGGTQAEVDNKVQLAMTQKNSELIKAINLKEKELNLDKEMFKAVKGGGPSRETVDAEEKERKERVKDVENMYAVLGRRSKIYQEGVDADAEAEQKTNVQSLNATRDILRRRTEYEENAAAERRQIRAMESRNEGVLLNETSQIFEAFYELSHKRNKVWFYAARGASAAETFINYQQAASVAGKTMGPLGIPMAAYFEALSVIKPALIMATAFSGPSGGGGGGAAPTSSYSPNSGMPSGFTQPGQLSPNLTIIINGSKVDYSMVTQGVVSEIYNNNGNVAGGFTVAVERSA